MATQKNTFFAEKKIYAEINQFLGLININQAFSKILCKNSKNSFENGLECAFLLFLHKIFEKVWLWT
jgi:hypothetical protein